MIPIAIINGQGYLFDLEHVKELRQTHNVTGVLVGVLPQFPQQNVFMGLPVQLMPEEVKYLLEKSVCFLLDDEEYHNVYYSQAIDISTPSQKVEMDSPARKVPEMQDRAEMVAKSHPVSYNEPEISAYNMYQFLMRNGMFCMPGLRFGCQFMAYPGDPLRYHAHYNARGLDYDENFDILDIVGCGRLATAVKKCWVVGAEDEQGNYRSFSIEWAAFG